MLNLALALSSKYGYLWPSDMPVPPVTAWACAATLRTLRARWLSSSLPTNLFDTYPALPLSLVPSSLRGVLASRATSSSWSLAISSVTAELEDSFSSTSPACFVSDLCPMCCEPCWVHSLGDILPALADRVCVCSLSHRSLLTAHAKGGSHLGRDPTCLAWVREVVRSPCVC